MSDIDEEELKHYLEITFDIMEKIATEINPIIEEIKLKHRDNYFACLSEIQTVLREHQIKYEPELSEKYNTSFMEYNQNMMTYRAYIEQYLKDKPDLKEKYDLIKNRMSFK